MNKKFKLLPHQVEVLQVQYDVSLKKLQNLNVIKKDEFADFKAASGPNEMNFGLDSSFLGSLEITSKVFKEADLKLKNYELIEQSSSDNIELGSCFEIIIKGEDFVDEPEVYVLVETTNLGDDYSFISIESPLGQAVMGATAGDTITYYVEGRRFDGTITKIIKPKQKTL